MADNEVGMDGRATGDLSSPAQVCLRRAGVAYDTVGEVHGFDVADHEMICRCEGVTAGTLRSAATDRGADEINRLKALTRIGMGRCQGRVCGHAAAEILARTVPKEVASVGRLRGNPPVKPIPVGGLS